MVNIYSSVEDLECTEHWEKADELRSRLTERFEEFSSSRGISYNWLDDERVEIEEGCSDCEITEFLEDVYDEFIEELNDEID